MRKRNAELREKRAKFIHDMRGLLDAAEQETRSLSAEEEQRYDGWETEVQGLDKEIERLDRQEERERRLPAPAAEGPDAPAPEPSTEAGRARRAFGEDGRTARPRSPGEDRWLHGSQRSRILRRIGRTPGAEYRSSPEYATAFEAWCNCSMPDHEVRALIAADALSAGNLIPPMEWIADLIAEIEDQVFIRRLATVKTLTQSDTLGVPSRDTDYADATWTNEIAEAAEDTTVRFGRRELRPRRLPKLIKISDKLLRINAAGAESEVRMGFSRAYAYTEENGYLTGDGGPVQPLGLFTASAQGISTARDVSTDNTTTEFTLDGLLNALYALKGQYQARAQWLFHRDAVKLARKIKDGEGRYMWQSPVQAGQPNLLFGLPVNQSEFVPSVFTTGKYVGMVADFSYYWIAELGLLEIQRLAEKYATQGLVGFLATWYLDGMPTLESAFARVKLG